VYEFALESRTIDEWIASRLTIGSAMATRPGEAG
jgi:hypothetical protein